MLQQIEAQAAGVTRQAPVISQEDTRHAMTPDAIDKMNALHPIPQGKKRRETIDAQLATFAEYQKMYAAVIDYHKKHCAPETVKDFTTLPEDYGRIWREFGYNRFMRRLLDAVYNEIIDRYVATHPYCGGIPQPPTEGSTEGR